MIKKMLFQSLIISVLNLFFASFLYGNVNEKNAENAVKIKTGVSKLGTGPNAKVQVKLYDKTKISGFVQETSDDHFVVVDSKTGTEVTIPYNAAKQVKGNNLSTGMKILIGVGIIAAIVIVLAVALKDD